VIDALGEYWPLSVRLDASLLVPSCARLCEPQHEGSDSPGGGHFEAHELTARGVKRFGCFLYEEPW